MSRLQINFESSSVKFILAGRIDASNANSFEDAVRSELSGHPDESVTFDCTDLEYVSSMGLRVLLALRKKRSSPVILENVSPAVMSILNITGFSQLFEILRGNN